MTALSRLYHAMGVDIIMKSPQIQLHGLWKKNKDHTFIVTYKNQKVLIDDETLISDKPILDSVLVNPLVFKSLDGVGTILAT
jgi:hypothetical protein